MSCKNLQAMLFYNQDYNNHDYKKEWEHVYRKKDRTPIFRR